MLPSELVKTYGGFVIAGLTTGGKANALFTGDYSTTSSTEVKTYNMENTINASFSFKPKGTDKSDADFTLGNSNGSTIASQNNIFNFKATVKTYGGNYGFGTFSVPKSIDDIHIDLAGWASSLNDKSTHVLVDFTDNGLRPLSDFITPVNLKLRINDLITYTYNDTFSFNEPIIFVLLNLNFNTAQVYLRTRFGEGILLSEINVAGIGNPNDLVAFKNARINYVKQIVQQKWLPFYKIKAVAEFSYESETYMDSQFVEYPNLAEAGMTKFYDTKNKMLYLLSQAQGRKFAYAIHDDYILDTYGIKDWVNAMATTTLTLNDLRNYYIIAL